MTSRSVIFTNVHKGASTFIADELGRYLHTTEHYDNFRPVGALKLKGTEISQHTEWPAEGLVGVRIYPAELRDLLTDAPGFTEFASEAALVFVQRDPRDAAVSLFYSKAYSHTIKVLNQDKFVEERERLQNMTPTEGVRELTYRPAIAEFSKLHQLHEEHGGLMTRYEDLVTAPHEWFRSVGDFVGWDDAFIETLIDRFAASFAPPDIADPLKHKRRITPGNWREVFDDELIADFDAKVGDRLRANGYA